MKNNQTTIQVIAGKFKGKKLKMADTNTTRSSKSILKESLFNTLYTDVIGSNFIEFFAGTGSIGIEALSRGAKSAIFFEKDKNSFNILKENLKNICSNCQYEAIFGDTFDKYKDIKIQESSIGYFDPPFCIRDNMDDIYSKTYDLIKKLDSTKFILIIIEHMSDIEMLENIGNFTLIKTRKFGNSAISYYKGL